MDMEQHCNHCPYWAVTEKQYPSGYLSNIVEYKGYTGSVEISEEDGLFYGQLLGLRSLISYHGNTATAFLQSFHDAVDSYLQLCAEQGIVPEQGKKIRLLVSEKE